MEWIKADGECVGHVECWMLDNMFKEEWLDWPFTGKCHARPATACQWQPGLCPMIPSLSVSLEKQFVNESLWNCSIPRFLDYFHWNRVWNLMGKAIWTGEVSVKRSRWIGGFILWASDSDVWSVLEHLRRAALEMSTTAEQRKEKIPDFAKDFDIATAFLLKLSLRSCLEQIFSSLHGLPF